MVSEGTKQNSVPKYFLITMALLNITHIFHRIFFYLLHKPSQISPSTFSCGRNSYITYCSNYAVLHLHVIFLIITLSYFEWTKHLREALSQFSLDWVFGFAWWLLKTYFTFWSYLLQSIYILQLNILLCLIDLFLPRAFLTYVFYLNLMYHTFISTNHPCYISLLKCKVFIIWSVVPTLKYRLNIWTRNASSHGKAVLYSWTLRGQQT